MGKDPTVRHLQVKDTETNKMISASHWMFFPQREGDDWRKVPVIATSDEHHKERYTTLLTNSINKRNAVMEPQPYLCEW